MVKRVVVKARPVLYACAGCPEHGNAACEVASELDRLGLAEASCLDFKAQDRAFLAAKARARFPVYALDGCADLCARRWLDAQGVRAQESYVLSAEDAANPLESAKRLAADWGG